jgi:hypothetical protein
MGSWFYGGGFYGSQGGAVYDCVFSNNSCALGGGVGTEGNCRFYRCLIRNNVATSGGGVNIRGGDVMDNCVIVSNVVTVSGSGIAFQSVGGRVRNCTVVGNSGGAGIYCVGEGILVNSIIVQNGGGSDNLPGLGLGYQADHLCTTPLPSNGTGHVTADPLFVSGWRLASNSPCIDAGTTDAPSDDFAHVPRPLDGNNDKTNAWDIGAFEVVNPLGDSDGDGLRDTNELTAGTSPLLLDTDGDGMGDNAEVRAGTGALDSDSFLFVRATSPTNSPSGILVSWPAVSGKRYRLERATNTTTAAFTYLVRTNIAGVSPMNVETDATVVGSGPWLYRVRLE